MLPLGVFAQESKIAIVNTQEVIQAMPEFATMQKQMADMEAKYKNEMQVMQDEYNKKYSDFVAQQDSLTEISNEKNAGIAGYGTAYTELHPDLPAGFPEEAGWVVHSDPGQTEECHQGSRWRKRIYLYSGSADCSYQGNTAVDATQFVKAKLGIN